MGKQQTSCSLMEGGISKGKKSHASESVDYLSPPPFVKVPSVHLLPPLFRGGSPLPPVISSEGEGKESTATFWGPFFGLFFCFGRPFSLPPLPPPGGGDGGEGPKEKTKTICVPEKVQVYQFPVRPYVGFPPPPFHLPNAVFPPRNRKFSVNPCPLACLSWGLSRPRLRKRRKTDDGPPLHPPPSSLPCCSYYYARHVWSNGWMGCMRG